MPQDEFVRVIIKLINAGYDAGVLDMYGETKKALQEEEDEDN